MVEDMYDVGTQQQHLQVMVQTEPHYLYMPQQLQVTEPP